MITLDQLNAAMPHAGARAAQYLPFLNAAMDAFDINTPARIQMFLANVAHESGDLLAIEENLNYSALGLCKTWPARFPNLDAAAPYNRTPIKIANKVYANRGGNGNEASGDGWTHRGAGLIQLTFHDNQKLCADYFGIDVRAIGSWLRTPEGASKSAAWFWAGHGCNAYADKGDFDGACDVINLGKKTERMGDAIGFADRLARYQTIQTAVA